MHRHKSVTAKVIEANRRNAQKSTGPKTQKGKDAVRHNAVRHGLLAKQVLFRNRGSGKRAFKELLDDLERDYMPVGVIEKMLVEEIGTCWWKLRTASRWEIKSLRGQRQASARVVEGLHSEQGDHTFLDSRWDTDLHQWECEALVIRSSKDNGQTYGCMAASGERPTTVPPNIAKKASQSKQFIEGTEIEATLKSSLPTILRYETTLKRDLYKAIQTLEELQRRRKEGSKEKHRKRRHHHS